MDSLDSSGGQPQVQEENTSNYTHTALSLDNVVSGSALSLGCFVSGLPIGRCLHAGQVFPINCFLDRILQMHVGERGLQSDSKFSQVGKQKQTCDRHGCPFVSDGAVCKEAHPWG